MVLWSSLVGVSKGFKSYRIFSNKRHLQIVATESEAEQNKHGPQIVASARYTRHTYMYVNNLRDGQWHSASRHCITHSEEMMLPLNSSHTITSRSSCGV